MKTAEEVGADFDGIALAGDSGSDRYDSYLAGLIPPDAVDILDVGCGSGRLSRKIAMGARRVVGIDLSDNMIARARGTADSNAGLTFLRDDFMTHDFGDVAFDCVISATMLHHVREAESAVKRMRELVKRGGRLIVHDVRSASGLLDNVMSSVAFGLFAVTRIGEMNVGRARRDAWKRHAEGEKYLTFQEAEALVQRALPGARVARNWQWRYTIVWDRPF